MTAIGLPMPRVSAQPPKKVSEMRDYFIRRKMQCQERAAKADFVCLRDDALDQVAHYDRLIAITEGRA